MASTMIKGLLNVRRMAILGSLLGVGSLAFGLMYFDSNLGPLQEHLSDDGAGYVLEQLREPNRIERETGKKSLERWQDFSEKNRFQLAYDIVRGKALNGMNGVDVMYALGGPTNTLKDNMQRFKFIAKGPKESGELYVTFNQEREPKVVYACIFVPAEERETK